jgi:NAD(P)H-dependent FMN reductase
MFVPVVLGTARKGRESEKVARLVFEEAVKAGLESELIDARDYRLEATDNTEKPLQAKKLAERVSKANALVIVSPEYNHSYPGELKMMLDLIYEQYRIKPVGICAVSTGNLGGARMVPQLKTLCLALNMIPVPSVVYFSNVNKLFDENGRLKDEDYRKRVGRLLAEIVEYAKIVKPLKA